MKATVDPPNPHLAVACDLLDGVEDVVDPLLLSGVAIAKLGSHGHR
jgi:hypothetical protein